MAKIYSYIIPTDDGAAPNPYGGVCTLTICKPAIRRTATEGCWIIGTGSKRTKLRDGLTYDFSKSLVYAMKVTDKKTLKEYDEHCRKSLRVKIPNWQSGRFKKRMGDCIYDYSSGVTPNQREGVHGPGNSSTDLHGKNALLSTHFYYFGSKPVQIPDELHHIIHTTQNCKLIRDKETLTTFEKWIQQYDKNRIYAEPQQKYKFENGADEFCRTECSNQRLKNNQGKNDSVC